MCGEVLCLHSNAIYSLINNNIKLLEYPSVSFSLSDDIRQLIIKLKMVI